MELLAGGRDADVFAFDDGLVLRRYRDGRSAAAESSVGPARLGGLGGLVRAYLATFAGAVPPSYTDRLDEAVALRRRDPNMGQAELAALPDAVRLARAVVEPRGTCQAG
ncbi:hypothetical protein GCM10027059_30630 [Myceligenerans halotolerans]